MVSEAKKSCIVRPLRCEACANSDGMEWVGMVRIPNLNWGSWRLVGVEKLIPLVSEVLYV
jgi:hypothetical protein